MIKIKAKKVDIAPDLAYRLLNPRHVVLVSCIDKAGKANIITLAWSMPTSFNPPLVAISVAPERYSHKLIQETKEFVVNVPTIKIIKETLFCGRRSGKNYNKFKETTLTPLPAKKVKPPIIKECIAHLECKLSNQIETGDHTIFIGNIVAAYANERIFNDTYHVKKVKPVYHLGKDDFVTINPKKIRPRL
ncbi:MAG: flavin reductase family protein [Euryarchaeota archaeon]|nr:flavin reductase family protein [Euryarchaeota archaeon]